MARAEPAALHAERPRMEGPMTSARADLSPLPPSKRSPVSADGDAVLALRAAAGDGGAFDALVVLYTERVFAVAFRMLADRAEAEDLTQEVFVTLHRALHTFRGESKLSTWIYRITKNRCLNRLKFLKRRKMSELCDIDDPAVANGCPDPSTLRAATRDPHRKLHNDELSRLIEGSLLELPQEQRALVVLRDLEDLSYEEIVEITGLPLGTVKSRLHRARLQLAKALGPELAARELEP